MVAVGKDHPTVFRALHLDECGEVGRFLVDKEFGWGCECGGLRLLLLRSTDGSAGSKYPNDKDCETYQRGTDHADTSGRLNGQGSNCFLSSQIFSPPPICGRKIFGPAPFFSTQTFAQNNMPTSPS